MVGVHAAIEARQRDVLEAALVAVDPRDAVQRVLAWQSDAVVVNGVHHPVSPGGRVWVLGAGKAAASMAQGVEVALAPWVESGQLGGLVVTKYGHGHEEEGEALRAIRVVEAAHPVPDAAGVAAGESLLRMANAATDKDVVIALISGGGSALLEALPEGVTLDDWQRTTALLLESGAGIGDVNALRKRLSLIKGGQLARACFPAPVVTLVLSDIVGSPLDAIASGPTVPDSTTWQDAWAVVEKYRLQDRLPARVRLRLLAGVQGDLPETPKDGDPVFAQHQSVIVGDNAVATAAAMRCAEALGYAVEVRTNALEGEAAEVAVRLIEETRAHQAHMPRGTRALLMWGGETTVTLGKDYGLGGRNQEMAVAAARSLDGVSGITFVALATDGTDGPTDCAGGWADGGTAQRARDAGIDLAAVLARHSAYNALKTIDALLVTGPTRTNVNDIAFAFVEAT